MSMYRQIWLALIMTAVIGFVGGLFASISSQKTLLEERLTAINTEKATSFAQTLSQQTADSATIKAAVAALRETERDNTIRVLGPDGSEISSYIGSSGSLTSNEGAPMWFSELFPLNPAPGKAQIVHHNDLISPAGTVIFLGTRHFAYKTLWESALSVAGTLLLCALLSVLVGALILWRMKKPINTVIAQAQSISEHHYVTTPESTIYELQQLTSAMNSSVMLLKKMFTDEAKRLELIRLEANSDPLTKLANRTYFMAQLQTSLETEDSYSGTILLVKIANLGEINKRLGRIETDYLLQSVTATITRAIEAIPNALVARLNGTDFGLLLPLTEAHPIADKLLDSLVMSTSAYIQSGPVAYICASKFAYGMNLGNLLSQIDSTLAGAEAQHRNCVVDAESQENREVPRSNEQWLKLIYDAIDNNGSKLAYFPVTDFARHLVHNECPLRLKLGDDWIPAGQFLPVAERLGMSSTLDAMAITLGIEELSMNREMVGLAINISANSLEDTAFCNSVRTMLIENSKAAERLWLELPEYGAYAHFTALTEFRKKIEGTGCRLGLEHFGRQFSQIGLLQDLKLDYIKVDASFIHDIANNHGNQVFLKGLIAIGHHIGMQVFAEGVMEHSEFVTLARLGFDGVTGPGVRLSPTVENFK